MAARFFATTWGISTLVVFNLTIMWDVSRPFLPESVVMTVDEGTIFVAGGALLVATAGEYTTSYASTTLSAAGTGVASQIVGVGQVVAQASGGMSNTIASAVTSLNPKPRNIAQVITPTPAQSEPQSMPVSEETPGELA